MADESYKRLIAPVHPAFNTSFTVGDCYDIAAITGLNVQDITGVIIGRTKPNDVVAERLIPYFGEEIVNQLIKDYNPYRFYEYVEIRDKHKYTFLKDVKSVDLLVGSCIYTNDGRWLKISNIESTETTTSLYSGGAHVGRFSNTTFFKAMIPKKEEKNNTRNRHLSEAENEQIRLLLSSDIEDGNMEERKQRLMSMINQIKESREV